MISLSKFAENLKDLLFDSKLTQKQLADITGIDKASINRYKAGTCMPNLKAVVKLAEHFNCSIDYLVGKTEESSHSNFLPCPPFNERLQLYLNRYGGTAYSLCQTVGLPDNKFYGWLAGTNFPRIDSVEKLADYFKCTIDQFLGREK